MMKARTILKFNPDRAQRIGAVKHVVYEYANLMAAAHYSLRGQAPWRTNCDDAFLLGCRKMDDFLLKNSRSNDGTKKLDDVLALDYMPSKTKRRWALPIWSGQWRRAMNKQLAHIAYARQKSWDHRLWVPQLEAEFNKAYWDFRDSVTDDDYGEELDRQLAFCQGKPGFQDIVLQRR